MTPDEVQVALLLNDAASIWRKPGRKDGEKGQMAETCVTLDGEPTGARPSAVRRGSHPVA